MQLKRLLWALLAGLTLLLAACQKDTDYTFADGTYEGCGEGRNGIILVRSTVSQHIITSVKVVSQSESSFAQDCINTLLQRALAKQDKLSLSVDGIAGATLTSTGVIDAVNMSLDAAMGHSSGSAAGYRSTSCDVVVVGAGGAGLTAAIEAADNGCSVIVLEKQGIVGGNTNYSTGGINAAETDQQARLGIQDSRALFFSDTYLGGGRLADTALVRSFVNNAAPTVSWLSSLGVDLSDVGLMGGSSVRRTHRPAGGTAIGAHLMKVLRSAAASRSVSIRTRNRVTGLLSSQGRVIGVSVVDATGHPYTITAKAVVLATGGFGGNLPMVTAYAPQLAGFATLNHAGATGDAFEWVTRLGGQLCQMELIQVHPTAEAVNHIMITEAVRGNGAILVNRQGQRFVDEMSTRDIVSAAILSQSGGVAYLVFDQGVRQSLASIETYANQGLLTSADSPDELASRAGISAADFAAALSRYNQMAEAGIDEAYGRPQSSLVPLLTAPYYAVCVAPAIHHTMGGVRVDTQQRVLNASGEPIPGLFAAGEVTGGLHGGNRLGGNGVADAVVNGRTAGRTAARSIASPAARSKF